MTKAKSDDELEGSNVINRRKKRENGFREVRQDWTGQGAEPKALGIEMQKWSQLHGSSWKQNQRATDQIL